MAAQPYRLPGAGAALALRPDMTKPRKPRRDNPEERLQVAVAAFLDVALKPDQCRYFHPANGEKRSKATAGRLKAMGVKPGVPDLCFVLPGGMSAFIELKAEGGSLSPAQRAFRDNVTALGAKWALCRTVEEVTGVLTVWGVHLHAQVRA